VSGRPPELTGLVGVPTYRGAPGTPVTDLVGTTPEGRPWSIAVAGRPGSTLLVFLTTTCQGCATFWRAAVDPVGAGLVADERLVVVARDPDVEDPSAVRRLAPAPAPVLMAGAAWAAYGVLGPPFFVLVDGPGRRVLTEGVAWSVEQVAGHLADARSGTAAPEVPRLAPRGEGG
jgi:hypothetical protein